MGADVRLNLLLTPPAPCRQVNDKPAAEGQAWHQTLTRLLVPLGVRTFEANSGPEAVDLIERHSIHLAVMDTRLPAISGLSVLELIQRLRAQGERTATDSRSTAMPGLPPGGFRFEMKVEEQNHQGQTQRRIEVRFDMRPPENRPGPVVILIAPPPPQQDRALLQEALKFNAFSVLAEPVDVNVALEVMARAMKRFHQNQWPV